jgi:hypothetical protein
MQFNGKNMIQPKDNLFVNVKSFKNFSYPASNFFQKYTEYKLELAYDLQ